MPDPATAAVSGAPTRYHVVEEPAVSARPRLRGLRRLALALVLLAAAVAGGWAAYV